VPSPQLSHTPIWDRTSCPHPRPSASSRKGKIKKVIDVRTMTEYRAGHYPRALHIPVDKINEKTTTELPKKGLLVYCNTGQRARFAAEKLEELGFEDVYYIAGTYRGLL
jgi:phage shock protein E